MANRFIPDKEYNSEKIERMGSNDSNCSNWTFSQRSGSSRPKSIRNMNLTPSHQGNKTPRQGSRTDFITSDEGNGGNNGNNNLRLHLTPSRSDRLFVEDIGDRERDRDYSGLNSPATRDQQRNGMMSPSGLGGGGFRSKSSPRIVVEDNPPPSSATRQRRSSGSGSSLLINSPSHPFPGQNPFATGDSEQVTPPFRRRNDGSHSPYHHQQSQQQQQLPSPPKRVNSSNSLLKIPEVIHINEPVGTSSNSRDPFHSSISGDTASLSREYDSSLSIANPKDVLSNSNSQSSFNLLSQAQQQQQQQMMMNNHGKKTNMIAGNMMNPAASSSFHGVPSSSLSASSSASYYLSHTSQNNGNNVNNAARYHHLTNEEFQNYFHTWKEKEEYYLNEINRLKEENLRLRSISKPFLSTVSLLVKNQAAQEHNQENGIGSFGRGRDGNAGGYDDSHQKKSSSSFKEIQSILSISSDDTTPGNSRSLSPVAVVRDDIFADLHTHYHHHHHGQQHHQNHQHQQHYHPNYGSNEAKGVNGGGGIEGDGRGRGDPDGGAGDANSLLVRKSSFQLPPLPPNYHSQQQQQHYRDTGGGGGYPSSESKDSQDLHYSHDEGGGGPGGSSGSSLASHPHLLKSEETIPFPVPTIDPSKLVGESLDSIDAAEANMKSMLKTPKSSVYDLSSYFNTHRKLLENLIDNSMKSPTATSTVATTTASAAEDKLSSTSSTASTVAAGIGGAGGVNDGDPGNVTNKLMENVIKPTLMEVKQRIESNYYTPELNQLSASSSAGIAATGGNHPFPSSLSSDISVGGIAGGQQQNGASKAAVIPNLKELETRKQQLENVWLLLATGFTALEAIVNNSYSSSNNNNHNNSQVSVLSSASLAVNPNVKAIPSSNDSPFKSVDISSIPQQQPQSQQNATSNILVDFTTLLTSFTLDELDHDHQ
jgi:hypothetical protein